VILNDFHREAGVFFGAPLFDFPPKRLVWIRHKSWQYCLHILLYRQCYTISNTRVSFVWILWPGRHKSIFQISRSNGY